MKTQFPRGDVKFYWRLHVNKMKARGENPVTYHVFYNRLRKGMNTHDAVYTPRCESQVRHTYQVTQEDRIRRVQTCKAENIPILELDEILEKRGIMIPAPKKRKPKKKTVWQKILRLFKRHGAK